MSALAWTVGIAAAAVLALGAGTASGEVRTRAIEYKHTDAAGAEVVLEGFLAYDDEAGEDRPGVLIVHEWWGLNDYPKRRAVELAEQGYVAFALDMFGKGKTAATADEAKALVAPLYGDRGLLRSRAEAGLAVLREQEMVDPSRLMAIGYCFGGTTALELARSGADLRVVVSFHGGLGTTMPAEEGKVKARVLALNGAEDPLVPHEERRAFMKEMTDAGADWQLVEYGGAVHGFTNPAADRAGVPGVAYNEKADQRSWTAMMLAFEEALGARD